MNASLVVAGLVMGLASSPHCAAMCSAPCAAIVSSCAPARPARALVAWHAGRIGAYGAAGALVSASVGLLAGAAAASALVKPIWTLMQVAVLVFGLALLASGHMPHWLDAVAGRVGRALRPRPSIRFFPRAGVARASLTGLAWVGLPCSVLYAALGVAALADGPIQGAAVMIAFSLGSAIGLFGLPMLWQRFARLERAGTLRLAGALLALGSGWALWHGLGDAHAAWCETTAIMPHRLPAPEG